VKRLLVITMGGRSLDGRSDLIVGSRNQESRFKTQDQREKGVMTHDA
jgi:hypothetical protein